MGVARREARWLVEEFASSDDSDGSTRAITAARRRLNGEPLQYILGHWPFRELDLDVDARVLIPRPETEELVTFALEELARRNVTAPIIVDLGCGSGAIGLALHCELRDRGVMSALVALDSSLDALDVTRINAIKHGVSAVSFVHSNWFDALDPSLRGRIDLIVSNPPYVAANEFETLDPVLRHEPYGALVSKDVAAGGGLADVAHIVEHALGWLSPRGVLIVEHGFAQGPPTRTLAREGGFAHVRTECDLGGHDRFLIASSS